MSEAKYYYKSITFEGFNVYTLQEGERVYDRTCHKGVWTLLITNEREPVDPSRATVGVSDIQPMKPYVPPFVPWQPGFAQPHPFWVNPPY